MRCSICGAEILESEILRRIRVVIHRPLTGGVCDCQATNIRRHLTVCGYFPAAGPPRMNPPIYS